MPGRGVAAGGTRGGGAQEEPVNEPCRIDRHKSLTNTNVLMLFPQKKASSQSDAALA